MNANGRRAHERGDVGRDPFPCEAVEILAQRGPLDGELDVALRLDHVLLHGGIQRPHGPAFAHDLQRHALANVALRPAIDEEAVGRPAQHVDEARRHGESLGLDDLRRVRLELPDGGDPPILDPDVRDVGGAAGTIVDPAARDHHIISLRTTDCGRTCHEHGYVGK